MKLTDTEREALWVSHADEPIPAGGFSSVHSVLERAVESIVAARLAEQREAIRVALVQQANAAWGEHNAAADDGCINAATEHGHAAETWEAAVTLVREYQPEEDT